MENSGRGSTKKTPAISGDSESKSDDQQYRPSEPMRRYAAASTFGVGPVEGQGDIHRDRRPAARASPTPPARGRSQERRWDSFYSILRIYIYIYLKGETTDMKEGI